MSDPGFEPTQVNMPPVQPGAPGAPTDPVPTPPGGVPQTGGPQPPGGPPPTDEPPEEPRDWRPWIIGGLIALIVLIILALLFLGDDDGDDDSASDTTTSSSTTTSSTSTSSTSTSTSTTVAPTTTTTPPAPTTTAAPPVTRPPELCADDGSDEGDPETPAQTVMAAWFRGDELCAAELMTPAARTDLFSRQPGDSDEEFQGCSEATEAEVDCAFTHPGGSTHFLMNFEDPWQVVDVFQVAD